MSSQEKIDDPYPLHKGEERQRGKEGVSEDVEDIHINGTEAVDEIVEEAIVIQEVDDIEDYG